MILSPCYLVHGGEPLQTEEIIGEITHQAVKDGYTKRVVFDVNTSFDWDELLNKCQNLDLFAERTLMEIRLHSDSVNKQGSIALEQVLQQQDPSYCILIRANKFKSTTLNSNWVKHIHRQGKVFAVKAIPSSMWPTWISKRLASAGFSATKDALDLIAKSYEGNLLAANQFILRISSVLNPVQLNVTDVEPFLNDSAQYSVFELINAVLNQDCVRCMRILQNLQNEGSEEILILWALTREIRNLLVLHKEINNKHSFEASAQRLGIWRENMPKVKSLLANIPSNQLEHLLRIAHNIDLTIKGMRPGHVWDSLLSICLVLCGKETLIMEDLSQ